MTDAVTSAETVDADPLRAFMQALPAHVRGQVHDTQRLAGLLGLARRRGWTLTQLVDEATRDLGGVRNAGAVVTHRMENCARHDPPQGRPKHRPPWCGACDADTRHVLDENGYPAPARCPQCHPLLGKVHA